MHWFWRATLAVLAAWAVRMPLSLATAFLFAAGLRSRTIVLITILTFNIELATAILVYALLTRRYYASRIGDGETRCRQCGYILRGISEPRCPECGERI